MYYMPDWEGKPHATRVPVGWCGTRMQSLLIGDIALQLESDVGPHRSARGPALGARLFLLEPGVLIARARAS